MENNEFHLAALPTAEQATLPTATPLGELGAVIPAPAPGTPPPIPGRTGNWWKTAILVLGAAGVAYYLGLERGRND